MYVHIICVMVLLMLAELLLHILLVIQHKLIDSLLVEQIKMFLYVYI